MFKLLKFKRLQKLTYFWSCLNLIGQIWNLKCHLLYCCILRGTSLSAADLLLPPPSSSVFSLLRPLILKVWTLSLLTLYMQHQTINMNWACVATQVGLPQRHWGVFLTKESLIYSPKPYCLYHYHSFVDRAAGWGCKLTNFLHQFHVDLKSFALNLEPWIYLEIQIWAF